MTTTKNYSQDEKLLAALAHGSIVTGQVGIVAAIAIYLSQREKSAYVAKQAAQAALYQLVGFFAIVIGWVCWGAFYFATFIPIINEPNQFSDAPPPIFWVGMVSMICPFILMAAWGLYGLIAAVQTWMGNEFKYAVIGNIVEQRLGDTAD